MPYFFLVSLTTYIFHLVLKYNDVLLLLNESKYNLKKYNKNIIKNAKRIFLTPELLGFILIVVGFILNAKITGICVCAFYLLLSLYELFKSKKRVKFTKKTNLTIFFIILLYIILFIFICKDYYKYMHGFFIYDDSKYYYLIIIVLGYLAYYVAFIPALLTNICNIIYKKIKKK